MLPLRPGDKLPQDPTFKDPPLWIHEVAAVVLSRRDSRTARGPQAAGPPSVVARNQKDCYAAFRSPDGNSPIAVLIASSTRSRNTNSSF